MSPNADDRVLVQNLTNTPQVVFAAGSNVDQVISHFAIAGGAQDEIVDVRTVTGNALIKRVPVKAGTYVEVTGFIIPEQGVQVVTVTAAGDVTVAVLFS